MYDAASTGSRLAVDTARTSPARRTGKTARSPWNRRNPYPATVVRNELLSGPGSAKEVRHLELDLGDSGITYEPGDQTPTTFVLNPINNTLTEFAFGFKEDSNVTILADNVTGVTFEWEVAPSIRAGNSYQMIATQSGGAMALFETITI